MKKKRPTVYFDRKAGRMRIEGESGGSAGRQGIGRPSFEGRWKAGSQQSLEEFIKLWEQRFL